MHLPRLVVLTLLGLISFLATVAAQDKAPKQPPQQPPKQSAKQAAEKKDDKADPNQLPHCKLPPAELIPNLCLVKYRVSTASPECQVFFDQGLGFYYSYTWAEAVRSFETATKHDPTCAMAWWGLSKACEKWGRAAYAPPLKKAQELMAGASHRESLLIRARLQEKGILEGVAPENRRKEAVKTLDELVTLYDDDEEAWFCRAQVADGPNAGVPFYKALLRVNPQHPGAHHELLHHYENIRRPALGWQHALGYMQSSPGLAHAFHMQAHLAMRIGKWDKTTDNSAHAIDLEEAYHKRMKINGADGGLDWQFPHHLETLARSLLHDGRYKEALALKAKCDGYKIDHKTHWFRLHLALGEWEPALKIADSYTKDKLNASYLRALVYLRQGDAGRAAAEVNVLQEAYPAKRNDRSLEQRLWEVQGALACLRGEEGGLKLLAKIVDKTKDDYNHHSWGQGAYFMESWGIAALRASRIDVAEEAFLEALAHDAGSARGALGMQVLCERQHRDEEALRFAELAQRCWRQADPGVVQAELEFLRHCLPGVRTSAARDAR
jgi:tetratricopeptide (TPR) repeat protein